MTPEPTADIVPFGKYRDRPVTDLLADRGYIDWLLAQPWFAERQPAIYNVIIGAGGNEPQDTPEHNAMQARFLDDVLCARLAVRYLPTESEMRSERARRRSTASDAQVANLTHHREPFRIETDPAEFEVDGWDVTFRAHAALDGPTVRTPVPDDPRACPWCRPTEHTPHCVESTARRRAMGHVDDLALAAERQNPANCSMCHPRGRGHQPQCPRGGTPPWDLLLARATAQVGLYVELKPVIADDFPTVLREVIQRRGRHSTWSGEQHRALVIADRLQPSSVTTEQVRAIFATRSVDLVLFDEIAAARELPAGGSS